MAKLSLSWLLSLLLLLAHAQASGKELVIGNVGAHHVVAEMPDGWVLDSVQRTPADAVTVKLTYGSAPDGLIVITLLQPKAGSSLAQDPQKTVHDATAVFAEQARAQSVEGTLAVNLFQSGSIQGAYFSATDKAPPPGEFKYLSRGIATTDKVAASFTALSHRDASSARDAVLQMIKSLRTEVAERSPGTP